MHIVPYLNFSGRCEEAIALYRSALGAETVMLMRNSEMPAPEGAPASEGRSDAPAALDGNKVLHAELRIGKSSIMCTDGGGMPATSFAGIALSASVADEAEAKRVFAALGEGGSVQMPLDKTFWSPCFGMLTDMFGVSWMVGVEGQA